MRRETKHKHKETELSKRGLSKGLPQFAVLKTGHRPDNRHPTSQEPAAQPDASLNIIIAIQPARPCSI